MTAAPAAREGRTCVALGGGIDVVANPPGRAAYQRPILVVDDDPGILGTVEGFLKVAGYTPLARASPLKVLAEVKERGIEVVVVDIHMPEMDGLELMARLREADPSIAVVVMTAYGSERKAVEAMKRGAYDYLAKPFTMDEFLVSIEKAIERVGLIRQNQNLAEQLRQLTPISQMVGRSRQMDGVRDIIRRIAPSSITVLVTGESGTGKELVAWAIHQGSGRAAGPFIKINCAALPETLLESELFGHERGAFTGAFSRQLGKFELADGGTMFLDEIGDMTLTTQTKILRVLQERSFERIGGKETLRVDARIVAATNRDLKREIARGNFRDDLYYRLNVVEIHMPPLREHPDDVPLMVEHFLEEFAAKYGRTKPRVGAAALAKMLAYSWPGNVRQLRNYLERVMVLELADDLESDLDALACGTVPVGTQASPEGSVSQAGPDALAIGGPAPLSGDGGGQGWEPETLDLVERRHIHAVLDWCGGNKTRAAKVLGIDPKTLRSKLKRLASWSDGAPGLGPTDG